jgi:carbon monoxide dehydrogenase subunit G
MHLEGKYVLKASRTAVWDLISNPEKIARCLPGLQKLEIKDSKTFVVTVKVGISFVKGNFKFAFTLIDQIPPSHSRFQASGRGAGVSVNMNTSMDLSEPQPGLTELSWKADVELGGLLGELSPSLIQKSTTGFTQEFFDCIKAQLETGHNI